LRPKVGPRRGVNVFLYDGAIVPDPDRIITGGHDNTTARTVAIHWRLAQAQRPAELTADATVDG
jgi:hypothetical protein